MKTLNSLKPSEITIKPYDPIEIMNKAKGNRIGYDCKKCNNEGVVYYTKDGYELCRDCECMEVRRCINRIEKSGLKEAFKKCTFDSFVAEQDFQRNLKSKAIEYISNYEGKWFFAGGQVGCGKTHICTAIARKFLLSYGKRVRYMQWRDEIGKIKSLANSEEQDKILDVWKKRPLKK